MRFIILAKNVSDNRIDAVIMYVLQWVCSYQRFRLNSRMMSVWKKKTTGRMHTLTPPSHQLHRVSLALAEFIHKCTIASLHFLPLSAQTLVVATHFLCVCSNAKETWRELTGFYIHLSRVQITIYLKSRGTRGNLDLNTALIINKVPIAPTPKT